jgi:hypothetical protein
MLLSTACLLALLANPLTVEAARLAKLIEELGNPVYAQRQEATKALEALGAPALPALEAAAASEDLEVRNRARRLRERIEDQLIRKRDQLIRKQVAAILKSSGSEQEKGTRLLAYIKPGMSASRVHELLGRPACAWGFWAPSEYYVRYGLQVDFGSQGVSSVRVRGDRE